MNVHIFCKIFFIWRWCDLRILFNSLLIPSYKDSKKRKIRKFWININEINNFFFKSHEINIQMNIKMNYNRALLDEMIKITI